MSKFEKYLLFSLIFALLNAALLLVFFVARFDHTDTPQYISTIENIAGDESAEIYPYRLLKPLPIFIGVILTKFTAAENTLIIQNILFYFLSVVLVYLLICHVYRNEKQAFYGTVLYGAAYPMLAYGLASLTDLPGWFFFLATALLSLKFLKNPDFKTAGLAGLTAGFGMLFKESTAAAPIFFVSLIFIASRLPIKEKIKHTLFFGLAFSFPVLISSIIIYQFYSVSYLDWFRHAWSGAGTEVSGHFYMVSPLRILIEIGRVFSLAWLFILLGAIKEFAGKNKERIKVLFAFFLPSLSFFTWSYPHNRMMYIAAPFLVLLGSFGLLRNFKNPKTNIFVEASLLFLYVFANYAVLEFLLRYGPIIQPPGTLFG